MKKLICAFVAAAGLCAPGQAFAQQAPAQQAFQGTLRKAIETGEIVISHRDAAVPFSYLDGDQKPVGYAHDICVKVAEDIKAAIGRPDLRVKFQLVSGANRIPLLLNGTIDLECGTTTNTVERQRQVAFSLTYFVAGNRLLTKRNSGIAELSDLRSRTVASNAGSTGLRQLIELNTQRSLGMTVTPGRDLAETFLLLETDRAAGMFLDDIILIGLAARSRAPGDYHLVGEALSLEPYSVMMRRDDPQLKAVVDASLRKLLESGEIEQLYAKWFLAPIPPQNLNLDFRVSRYTRRAWQRLTDTADPEAYR
jgi:glutamate/aspartate transport system substrate-binding protein